MSRLSRWVRSALGLRRDHGGPERWDARYREPGFAPPWLARGVPVELREAVEGGWLTQGSVLDVGCGLGVTAHWLSERGFSVRGVDFSQVAIDAARARYAESAALEFRHLDICAEAPGGEAFSGAVDWGCFHHVHERGRYVEHVAAALQPGSPFLLYHKAFRSPGGVNDSEREELEASLRRDFGPFFEIERSAVAYQRDGFEGPLAAPIPGLVTWMRRKGPEGCDLFAPGFLEDPFRLFARLRAEDPVHLSAQGIWVVTGFEDVVSLLGDSRLSSRFSARSFNSERFAGQHPSAALIANILSTMDPPEHTLLRGLLDEAFSMRDAPSLRPLIEAVVDEVIAEALDSPAGSPAEFDVARDVTNKIPLRVFARLFKIPAGDVARFAAWSNGLVCIFDPMLEPELAEELSRCVEEFTEYLEDLIAERTRTPGDDVVSALLAARVGGQRFSERDLISNAMLILAAGEKSTAYAMSNAVHALLSAPEQLTKIREGETPMNDAVEELLRFCGPTAIVARTALEDFELGGREIKAGDAVALALASANRDGREFPGGDRLDLDRRVRRHLAFGSGIHYCAGARLARIEIAVTLERLFRALPAFELAEGTLVHCQSAFVRGFESLPVRFKTQRGD